MGKHHSHVRLEALVLDSVLQMKTRVEVGLITEEECSHLLRQSVRVLREGFMQDLVLRAITRLDHLRPSQPGRIQWEYLVDMAHRSPHSAGRLIVDVSEQMLQELMRQWSDRGFLHFMAVCVSRAGKTITR